MFKKKIISDGRKNLEIGKGFDNNFQFHLLFFLELSTLIYSIHIT